MSDRVAALPKLTVPEKASLVQGYQSWRTTPVPRLGIGSIFLTDGPHGVRRVRDPGGSFSISDNVHASSFPTASALAASWDPELVRRIGAAIGHEAADQHVDVLLAPGVNIQRDPRCGRNFEYYSEDPLVSGVLGAAFVQGVQSQGVGASVKHMAANSNEEYRFVGNSVVDERALREIYLRAFERVVTEAAPATVMCAYNQLNGTACSQHRWLLTEVLRDEWGFDGLVMSDWGATDDRPAGVAAGLDLEMPGSIPHNHRAIVDAVRSGALAERDLDTAVGRVLRLVERSCHATRPEQPADPDVHAALAREAAADAAVLLRNDGTLPLSPDAGRIVVVGEMFEQLRFQGAGSSLVTPPAVSSAKDAFDRRGLIYRYAPGYRTLDLDPDPVAEAEALALARDADVVLVFGGLGDLEESEGFDRPDLRLSRAQTRLIERLAALDVPVVLVLHAGAPVIVPALESLAAVLLVHLPGMQGGEATADLLLGDVNPSGRLTQSWVRAVEDVSDRDDYDQGPIARYYESIHVGYRFHDAAGTDLLAPFGFGLSYTRFEHRDLRVALDGDRVTATVTVANVGDRDGADVVQLYVRNAPSAVFKADKELRAFAKVPVPAGGTADATLEFPLADLAYWDVAEHGWVLENGDYEVQVGASAADLTLTAPLPVRTGRASRSPYPAAVDRDYATPPTRVPPSFPDLVGRPVPQQPRVVRPSMRTRLADSRVTLPGRLLYAVATGATRRDFERALAMPPSLERDARVKNDHFTMRMTPTMSLHTIAMASGGRLPYRVAAAVGELVAGRPLRALRALLRL